MRVLGLSRGQPWAAWATLVLLACTIFAGFMLPAPSAAPRAGPVQHDADLYRAIAARVASGTPYYPAAAAEQRARGYPLKPFVTMRPPLLAEVTGLVGTTAMGWLLRLAVLGALAALVIRLRASVERPAERLAALAIGALALLTVAQPALAIWHEVWAATLATVALAVRTDRRWLAAIGIATLAALLRELAAPLLVAMAGAAWIERRRGEALAWLAGLGVFALALAFHAGQVTAVTLPGDGASQGWSGGGWPVALTMLHQTSLFAVLPRWIAASLVPLALLGWASRRDAFGQRVALWLLGMTTLFCLAGRPDNLYWGMMVAPLLPVGLAFAPRALLDLGLAARH